MRPYLYVSTSVHLFIIEIVFFSLSLSSIHAESHFLLASNTCSHGSPSTWTLKSNQNKQPKRIQQAPLGPCDRLSRPRFRQMQVTSTKPSELTHQSLGRCGASSLMVALLKRHFNPRITDSWREGCKSRLTCDYQAIILSGTKTVPQLIQELRCTRDFFPISLLSQARLCKLTILTLEILNADCRQKPAALGHRLTWKRLWLLFVSL